MKEQSTIPLYSEEQATRWLAWLAYNMRQRDLTVFQIEGLQPNWLAGRREIATHLLLTRALLGVMSSLIFIGTFLSGGLTNAMSVGLIIGLIEFAIPIYKLDVRLRSLNSLTKVFLIGMLVYSLIFGLILSLMFDLSTWMLLHVGQMLIPLEDEMITTLIIGLSFGYMRTSRVTQRGVGGHIRTFESLQWSWQHVRQNAAKGRAVGLFLSLIYFLILFSIDIPTLFLIDISTEIWIGMLIFTLISNLIISLVVSLIFSLIGGLIGGFQPSIQSMKTRPNQGIWLTIQSARKIGLSIGFVFGVLIWFFSDFIAGLSYGIVISIIIGLWYGGLDATEHAIIRLIITRRGHAPLNYAHFLDYAANELNFLQKVGGGYVFIHRYLLEHFAEIAVEQGYVDVNARRHPQSF